MPARKEEKKVTHKKRTFSLYFNLFVQGPREMPIIPLKQNLFLSFGYDIFYSEGSKEPVVSAPVD